MISTNWHLCISKPYSKFCTCAYEIFVNLIQARVICKEGTSTEESPPPDWPVGKCVGAFSLSVFNVDGPSLLWTYHPWTGGPGFYKKPDGEISKE